MFAEKEGVTTGCILPIGLTVKLSSNFAILNMKLFSIRVKELFEPIVLRKKTPKNKTKPTGFCSFQRAFSRETDL